MMRFALTICLVWLFAGTGLTLVTQRNNSEVNHRLCQLDRAMIANYMAKLNSITPFNDTNYYADAERLKSAMARINVC